MTGHNGGLSRERGVFWTPERQALVRRLLAQGVDRDGIAQRMCMTRPNLRTAIHKFHLDQPVAP